MDFDDSSELLEQFGDVASDRACCLVFRWGGDIVERACAMVLSYALAKHDHAVVTYEREPPADNLDAFRAEVISVHGHAKLKRPRNANRWFNNTMRSSGQIVFFTIHSDLRPSSDCGRLVI